VGRSLFYFGTRRIWNDPIYIFASKQKLNDIYSLDTIFHSNIKTMKNPVALFLSALLMMFVISCEEKPNENEEDPVEIYGKWAPLKSELFTYEGDVLTGSSEIEIDWYMIQFNEDGYFIVYLDENNAEDTEVLNWTRSGDVVVIDEDQYNIESLTREQMVLSTWESATEKYVYTCTKIN